MPEHCAAIRGRVAPPCAAPGPVDRLRQRLQDHGRHLHGDHLVGLQSVAREKPGVLRLQGDAVLHGLLDAALELRGQPELQGRQGPRRHRELQGRGPGERLLRRVDDHALDAALQPGPVRQPRAGVCQDPAQGAQQGVHPLQGEARPALSPDAHQEVEAREGRGALRHPRVLHGLAAGGNDLRTDPALLSRACEQLPDALRQVRHGRWRYGRRAPGARLR
mmetsp:Transcript_14165/g.53222  ORF Transcript_14165/g.53222 Transcript_14165/m.53222 type:complete len:220 (+) Transcript_14165:463-1122(+)